MTSGPRPGQPKVFQPLPLGLAKLTAEKKLQAAIEDLHDSPGPQTAKSPLANKPSPKNALAASLQVPPQGETNG